MNIFLMGYMGCGKSTTGKLLAKKLKMTFVDLDEWIEKSEQIKIESFFEEEGEKKFRELEHHYLKKTIEYQNTVIALGGGTPCYHNNIRLIREKGVSVYLKVPAAALVNRLMNSKSNRPLIKHKTQEALLTFVKTSLFEREKFYQQANYTINAINLNIEQLINRIKN